MTCPARSEAACASCASCPLLCRPPSPLPLLLSSHRLAVGRAVHLPPVKCNTFLVLLPARLTNPQTPRTPDAYAYPFSHALPPHITASQVCCKPGIDWPFNTSPFPSPPLPPCLWDRTSGVLWGVWCTCSIKTQRSSPQPLSVRPHASAAQTRQASSPSAPSLRPPPPLRPLLRLEAQARTNHATPSSALSGSVRRPLGARVTQVWRGARGGAAWP